MRVAINGCGIAGPALAWWLREFGFEPVLFESARALRTGGYIVDFWGSGYDIAEKMGLIPGLLEGSYAMERMRTVSASGRTTSSTDVRKFREAMGNRFLSVPRGDLSKRLFEACGGIEARFGRSIVDIEDRGSKAAVRLSDGGRDAFDLVVGADGLHSHIRARVFGPEDRFERPTGYYVAAFSLEGYRPRDEGTFVSHTVPGLQLSRATLRGDRTMFLFVFSDRFVARRPAGEAAQKELLGTVYRGMKWEAGAVLGRIDEAQDFYFDRVSQIRMPGWTTGRVALLGDAAACVSLLAGEGAGLAMAGAYVLAGELRRAGGDRAAAFAAYEARLRSHVAAKQRAALKFARFFTPDSRAALLARDALANLAPAGVVARLLLRNMLRPVPGLPAYEDDPVEPG